ncbi:MAG: restriction endonuclease subunit S [Micropruina sp.]|uniref:restriction endonuclease subunit S n=1 Tax=Micropruina sp. TaxID=2737536 RepID=UPI0039E4E084
MSEWVTTSLPDVLDFREGPGILAVDFREQGIPLIRLAGIKRGARIVDGCNYLDPETVERKWSQFRLIEGDVLLSTSASLGEVARVVSDGVGAVPYTGIIRFRPRDERIDPLFIESMLTARDFKAQIEAMGVGSVMKHFGPSHLRRMSVSYPVDVRDQRAIAEILRALDDKIAGNAHVVDAATSLAVTLAGAASGVVVVSDIVRHATTQLSPKRFDALVAHYSLPAFDAGNRPEGSIRASIKSNKFLLERPAVLVSKLNPRIPRVWDVAALPERMAVASTEFVVLEPIGISTTALWASLSQPAAAAELASNAAGTSGSHQRVRPAEVLALRVPDPRKLGPGLLSQVDSIGLSVHHLRGQNERLAATRDQLLPLLMSGRLRVKDAERAVEEVL